MTLISKVKCQSQVIVFGEILDLEKVRIDIKIFKILSVLYIQPEYGRS